MAIDPSSFRVALLAGGSSGEREISLASGDGAAEALNAAGFTIDRIDPANESDLKRLFDEQFDVAFLCLHGKNGEDGTIQGMLQLLGIPYTCSGVQASALAIDKQKSKVLYEAAGIPTAKYITIEDGNDPAIDHLLDEIGSPVVIKPATEGSALGVEIVNDIDEVPSAIDRVLKLDSKAIIEQFIAGTEVTVAVLGNRDLQPLPVIEIIPQGDFYDFTSKYAPGGSTHICPARLSETVTETLMNYAQAAHLALGCSGVSRSDFIVDSDGKPWILETNTIPGMTSTSLLPDAARAAGISFPDLCVKLIEFALETQ